MRKGAQVLRALNRQLLEALGFVRGVTHAEFIKGQEDGQSSISSNARRG